MPGALGLLGNPPGIRTPGIGPNGPLGVDARIPITSVGAASSVPYGPTLGYATPNGVTGFVGPAAGSLYVPTTWYIRSGGSNNNGGTSTSLSPERSGSDASVTGTALTSASANFTSTDIGKGINVVASTLFNNYKIVAVVNATTATVYPSNGNLGSGLSWAIGGSWADLRAPVADISISNNGRTPVLAGDTIYVGAGTYRQVYQVSGNFNSLYGGATGVTVVGQIFNGQVNIIGDVTGQHTGDAGMVQLTAYTTNDKTAPSGTTLLNLSGRSNLAFSNIMFVGGSTTLLTATTLTSQNVFFTDCGFLSSKGVNLIFNVTAGYANSLRWQFDRCSFIGIQGSNNLGQISLTSGNTGNDYDANVFFINSNFFGGGIQVAAGNALAKSGGGVRIRNVFALAAGATFFFTGSTSLSTVIPCSLTDSFILSGNQNCVQANNSGQIVENYNLFVSSSPRSNVSAGAHSVSDGSYAPLFHFGQERMWGALLRRFGEPMAGSPLLGFGNDGTQTLYDLANGPRPAGAGAGNNPQLPAVGALERSNTASQGTSPVPPSGTHTWQNTGPWYQDFLLPVSNVATTIGISVQRDSAYAPSSGRTLPALLILANDTLGVTAQTIVDAGASGGWNTLTAAVFTPSGSGWVTVRIASYDGSGVSVVSFADVTVT